MTFDSRELRSIFGRFATGITVITASTPEGFQGMTANAVTSLSLDPPLILVAIDKRASMHLALRVARQFAVNILSDQQEAMSRRFASPGPKDFSDLNCIVGSLSAPLIPETLGYVECQLTHIIPGGDHDIFVGEVLHGAARDGNPLLYFQGKYRFLAPQ